MQRLHCWLDQLSLRRSSRRSAKSSRSARSGGSNRRVTSQSVAPSCRLNAVNAESISSTTQLPQQLQQHFYCSRDELDLCRGRQPFPVSSLQFPPPPPISELNSIPRRSGIRTNPWISERGTHTSVERNDKLMSCSSRSAFNAFDRRSGCFEVRPPTLGVKSLDESTCSSGYASQDVSPDSSMHLPSWHSSSPRSGSWKSGTDEGFYGLYAEETPSLYDNIAAEEHVYHELMRSYSSELLPSCSEEASRSPTPLYDRIASPVYATPWTNYPLIQKSDCGFEQRPRPLIVRNKNWQQPNIVYAQPYRGPMIQPHVAERQFEQPNSYFNRKMRDMEVADMRMKEEKKATMAVPEDVDSNEEAENENANEDVCEEFLTALDEQINELQIRSEELRTLVEKARIRRREWLHPQLECTFELAI